jgi:hypothetical protein
MILTLIVLSIALLVKHQTRLVDLSLLRKAPIVAILILLAKSEEFMRQFAGLSFFGTEERNRYVAEMDFKYRIEAGGDGENDHQGSINMTP